MAGTRSAVSAIAAVTTDAYESLRAQPDLVTAVREALDPLDVEDGHRARLEADPAASREVGERARAGAILVVERTRDGELARLAAVVDVGDGVLERAPGGADRA